MALATDNLTATFWFWYSVLGWPAATKRQEEICPKVKPIDLQEEILDLGFSQCIGEHRHFVYVAIKGVGIVVVITPNPSGSTTEGFRST